MNKTPAPTEHVKHPLALFPPQYADRNWQFTVMPRTYHGDSLPSCRGQVCIRKTRCWCAGPFGTNNSQNMSITESS